MLDDYYKSLPESYKEAIAYLESQVIILVIFVELLLIDLGEPFF